MTCFIICIHESKAKSILFPDVRCQDLLRVQTAEFSSEGSSVTLSYNISKPATAGDYFYWYRQYPGKPAEFLVVITGSETNTTSQTQPRFSTKLSEGKSCVFLSVSCAELTDSAVYMCAVRPTVLSCSFILYKNPTPSFYQEVKSFDEDRVIKPHQWNQRSRLSTDGSFTAFNEELEQY